MTMAEQATTGQYRLHAVELVESSFTKNEAPLDLNATPPEPADVRTSTEIKTSYTVPTESFFWVRVSAAVRVTIKEDELLSAHVTMKGLFQQQGETKLSIEKFGEVNGPAILFPFLREHIASLTLKANVPPILLAPINFVSRAEAGQ